MCCPKEVALTTVSNAPKQDLDRRLMAGAIALARRGLGRTAPNPAVGAVLYRPDLGEIVGRGWTQPGGRPHAEPVAIASAGERAKGATLYVTLEPCAHHGRTPPCVEAIIAAGISRVVFGITDPDPRVSQRGLRILENAGIEVVRSALVEEAHDVTIGHVLRVSQRRPFVQVKIAVHGNGQVPTGHDGAPVWATGTESRARGHMMRAEADAILVGRGTARADNPSLDCRLPGFAEQSPLRVVLSGSGALDDELRIFEKRDGQAATLVFVGQHATSDVRAALRERGAEVQVIGDVAGSLWIPAVLDALVERGITRLLVEGGPSMWRAFDRAGMIDEVVMFRGALGEATFDAVAAEQMLARYVSQSQLVLRGRARVGDDDMVTWWRA